MEEKIVIKDIHQQNLSFLIGSGASVKNGRITQPADLRIERPDDLKSNTRLADQ